MQLRDQKIDKRGDMLPRYMHIPPSKYSEEINCPLFVEDFNTVNERHEKTPEQERQQQILFLDKMHK